MGLLGTVFGHQASLTAVTRPLGNFTACTYDSLNPDRFQQANLLSVQQTPDDSRPAEHDAIESTYTYEPLFNQLRSVTSPRGNDSGYVPDIDGTPGPDRSGESGPVRSGS